MWNRFRLSRGPLRWWLLACGLVLATFDSTRLAIGLTLVLVGAALHLVAKACLWQNRILSTAGPYRFTRNPFYLANLAIDAGLMVVIGNVWVAVVFSALWMLVYRQTIADEERTLRQLFGDSFEAYCARVPRLVPRPWRYLRWDESTGPSLTWRNPNLVTGTEWPRVLRILSSPWIMACAGAMRASWLETEGPWLAMATGGCALTLWCLGELAALWISRRKSLRAGLGSNG